MKQFSFTVVAVLFAGHFVQLQAQTTSPYEVVERRVFGDKVLLELNLIHLEQSMDTLFSRLDAVGSAASSVDSLTWSDVLGNGSDPGMDVDFNSNAITGVSGLTSTGLVTTDSLFVTDVINGKVNSLSNHSTTNLVEGDNLYFTDERAVAALSDTLAYLLGLIADLQSGGGGGSSSFTCGTSTVTFDGHDYSTVEIGGQCWFAENLRSDNYADGDAIPGELSDGEWSTTEAGAQAVYDNDASNLATYGRLYNWHAVADSRGLCPSGWHVPTDEEWTALTDELGGGPTAGGAMKAASTDTPSWDGSNTSGFSALPGGGRNDDGYFLDVGNAAYFWSSSPSGSDAWLRGLYSGADLVNRFNFSQRLGFSVRCVRD